MARKPRQLHKPDDKPDFHECDAKIASYIRLTTPHLCTADDEKANYDRVMEEYYQRLGVAGGQRKPPVTFTRKLQAEFLYIFQKLGQLQAAARLTGIGSSAVFYLRKTDPLFAELYEEALETFRNRLVQEVYRRGVEGVEEYVTGKDGVVWHEGKPLTKRVYSDTLLLKLWQYADPKVADRTVIQVNESAHRALDNELNLGKLNRKQRDALRLMADAFGDEAKPETIDAPAS